MRGGVLVSVDGGLRVRQGFAVDHQAAGYGRPLPRRRRALGVRVPRAGATILPDRLLRRGPRKHCLGRLQGMRSGNDKCCLLEFWASFGSGLGFTVGLEDEDPARFSV